MTKAKNKVLMVMLGLMVLVLSACGSNTGNNDANDAAGSTNTPNSGAAGETADNGADTSKEVELTWYFPVSAVPAAMDKVAAEANKIIKEKINATVKFMPVAFGDYTQKMNTVVASGEKTDLIWTSNWNFDYVQNQGKGAFLPLNELIDNYAPDVKASMPDFVWKATEIDGQIYGVPNYQTVTNREGFLIQKRYIDKLGIDISTLKKPSDLTPILEKIHADDSSVIPMGMDNKGKFGNMNRTYNMENVITNIAVIDLNDPGKIINMYETPQYEEYLAMVQDWFEKGYINQDAATLKNAANMNLTGNVITSYHNVLKPGGEAESKVQMGGQDMVYVPVTDVYTGTNTIITTMSAVSRTSENPERAMQLINLVNTDKELYNLLIYGIEGTNYTKTADDKVKLIPDSGYALSDWVLGNVFNGYVLDGKDPEVAKQTKAENESAKPSPIMGFKFKSDAVMSQIANVTSVVDEYSPGLNTGVISAADKLAEFRDKLKQAGIDEIIAEAQKQLDAWKASQ
ncbi:ABC transporter substrate-binding protein [Paenibacillus sepulcri]|uniref:Extracellular solute-binding protein n=1 Tax=Paenibacillus sepulcri TaxID=359917 RepID=A0ABS7C4G4_9BACL|nr:extracellular solute-binding protein [Paenibacillus sepulcri]